MCAVLACLLNANAQELGQNASFYINGTKFSSTSNTITSDISRIDGVTFTLKEASEGTTTTITVEKDADTAANAVQDIVDAYNLLIENVDKEIAADGNLNGQMTLKLIRNQIRNLMVNSTSGSVFRNLASVGITTGAASVGDLSVTNIEALSFDKETLFEIAPKIKDYNPNQMLEFYTHHYENNDDILNKENLIYSNLEELISNKLIGANELTKLLTIYPLTDKFIGKIPSDWLNNLNQEEKLIVILLVIFILMF